MPTKIEWTDETWNPITGCTLVSDGCANCYAARLAATRLKHHPSRKGLARLNKAGVAKFTGKVRFNAQWLTQPLKWKRPRMIFVCAHGDLFHEDVPDEWIDQVFAVMALCPQHIFQVLTKRPERMREYLTGNRWADGHASERIGYQASELSEQYDISSMAPSALIHGPTPDLPSVAWPRPDMWPLPNVWLGTSIEDQATADARIPALLDTPAAKRFISAEPLLEPVTFRWAKWQPLSRSGTTNELDGLRKLDWVIVGGESGPNARPMHPDWARTLRDQCEEAEVPFFFKQWGAWVVALDRDEQDPDWRADYSNKYADGDKTRWLNIAGGCGFHGERFHVMRRAGKSAAGRLLDGVEHNAMPEAR